MFKSRSITLFVSSILTTIGFIIMLCVTIFTSAEDVMIESGYTPGSDEFEAGIVGLQYIFILTTIVLFLAVVLYWLSFATKMSGFVLAGAIILTVSLILTLFGAIAFVIIPLVLGFVSFAMQRKINARERMFSSAPAGVDPTMMQF